MPVVSKYFRSKKTPPLLGPQPYQSPRQAWSATGSQEPEIKTTGDEDKASPGRSEPQPKGSILRNARGEAPPVSPRPSRPSSTVTFNNRDDYNEAESPRYYHKTASNSVSVDDSRTTGSVSTSGRTGGDVADASNSATSPVSPRSPRSPSRLGPGSPSKSRRPGMSVAQTLQECEEHTDWANGVLAASSQPLISDLRTSIGDGHTLPTLLEITAGEPLKAVKSDPKTKEERIRNIRDCLKFLSQRGIGTIDDLQPPDLENGDLRSILVLVGAIRKHFKGPIKTQLNGHADDVAVRGTASITEKESNMPGAMKLPGAVPTPFTLPPQTNSRHAEGDVRARSSAFQEVEMLPGMLGKNVPHTDNRNNLNPHSNIISTTEIGMNGVAQHGVDERKSHFANNNNTTTNYNNASQNNNMATNYNNATQNNTNMANNRGGMVIRHQNAKGVGAGNMHEKHAIPPSAAHRAWTGSPHRLQANNVKGPEPSSGSVEDRLRQLISKNSSASSRENNMASSASPGIDGYFHCGGSEVFDTDGAILGEVLDIPPPAARKTPDFEVASKLHEHNYGPGYRQLSNQHERQKSQQGYVPSKPAEKLQGSRADIIRSRPPSAIAFRQRKAGPQVASFVNQNRPNSAHGDLTGGSSYNGGHENSAYVHDTGGPMSADFPKKGVDDTINRGISPQKVGSNDLRNAWNRLYGPQGQVPPYKSPVMKRGDNLRASYGPLTPQGQVAAPTGVNYRSSPGPSHPGNSRPVSAPAPAHMQAYFQSHDRLHGNNQDDLDIRDHQGHGHVNHSNQRESPTGQSSSTQGHLDESNSSQQSKLSQDGVPNLHVQTGGDINTRTLSQSSPSTLSQPSPKSPASPNYAIGPASKYPDLPSSRPSSARKPQGHGPPALPARSPQRPDIHATSHKNVNISENVIKNDRKPHNVPVGNHNSSHVQKKNNFSSHDLTTPLQVASREHRFKFDTSHDLSSHNQSHDLSQEFQNHSIFDYNVPSRSESTGSVTPPLPPLSPTNTPPDSPRTDDFGSLQRSVSANNVSAGDLNFAVPEDRTVGSRRLKPRGGAAELNFRMASHAHGKKSRRLKSKGANLNEVRESDSGSNLSFDIDDTFLTVESHDTDQPHPAGDILSSHEVTTLRNHMHDLEYKYHDLQGRVLPPHVTNGHPSLGKSSGMGPPPIGRQRRWSIGSSDTSSFRRESKFKPGKQIHHKHQSREFKNINKRFQKLESHVVTLARSVAHLSNELRTHNTMVNDLEAVKRQLKELRENPSRPFPNMMGSAMTEQDRFREWVPGLTNPKRVNKLTKFFGAEPPLLEFFLKKLGYERYIPNFKSEHIGMIELPYMTEDRLEKIGVPMGPRIRILQEAQQCFRHENIYLV